MRAPLACSLLCLLFTPIGSGAATPPKELGAVPPVEINALLAEVSPARLQAAVATLAAFGTRHTLSDTSSPTRGIGAARNWIKAQFEHAARASGRTGELAPLVKFDSHRQEADGKRVTRAVDIVNVVAELPGARPESRQRRVYVIAHYDSRASDPLDAQSDAPGANDNASGTALVMELFRVLAPRRFDATLVFMATAGEEQGLLGARAHAATAKAAIVTANLDNSTTLRWQASADSDVTGYQVVWRDTTSPTWQHSRDVGPITTITLSLSKDDFHLGVRAVDRDGYRSVVSFPSVARQ